MLYVHNCGIFEDGGVVYTLRENPGGTSANNFALVRRRMAVRENGFYGWKLLLALSFIVATNLSFPLYGGGLIGTYMAADLHFDRSTLGVAFGIFQWMIGLPGPLVALSVHKKGVRFTLALGTSLVVIGALTMALFVHTRVQLYIVFGIIIASGAITGGAIAARRVFLEALEADGFQVPGHAWVQRARRDGFPTNNEIEQGR